MLSVAPTISWLHSLATWPLPPGPPASGCPARAAPARPAGSRRAAAGHDGQRARLGAGHAARHRRVEEARAVRAAGARGNASASSWRVELMSIHSAPGASAGQRGVDHCADHRARLPASRSRSPAPRTASARPARGSAPAARSASALAAVRFQTRSAKAGLGQPRRHRPAHQADAEKCQVRVSHVRPFSLVDRSIVTARRPRSTQARPRYNSGLPDHSQYRHLFPRKRSCSRFKKLRDPWRPGRAAGVQSGFAADRLCRFRVGGGRRRRARCRSPARRADELEQELAADQGYHLSGYWDANWRSGAATRLNVPGEHQEPHGGRHDAVFRYEPTTSRASMATPASAQPLFSSCTATTTSALSTAFEFADHLGVGYVFANQWELGAKLQHYSNGGIKHPNSGVNWFVAEGSVPLLSGAVQFDIGFSRFM